MTKLFKRRSNFSLMGMLVIAGMVGGGLSLALTHFSQTDGDRVTTTASSTSSSSSDKKSSDFGDGPLCLFHCSDVVRSQTNWSTATTLITNCKSKTTQHACPPSFPKMKQRHAHTSLSRTTGTNLYYLWVREYHCCKL